MSKAKRASRRKTCRDCGGRDEVIDGLCSDCDANYVYCSCCDERHEQDSTCRHVFWTDFGWCGAGSNETDPEDVKDDFFALLDRIDALDREKKFEVRWYGDDSWCEGLGVVEAIRAAVHENRFWTFAWGPMLGCPTLDLNRQSDRDKDRGVTFASIYGDRLAEDDGSETSEGIAVGWHWLASLCADETVAANILTVRWIDEWRLRRARTERRKRARFRGNPMALAVLSE